MNEGLEEKAKTATTTLLKDILNKP
jgi:hypothetical protein